MPRETAALGYEEQQAKRRARRRNWQVAADAEEVPKWQAFQARYQINKQILRAWISHLFEKILGK